MSRPTPPMMKCGHAANAKNAQGDPVCVICIGIVPGADIIDDTSLDLAERKARCFCGRERPSSPALAFFEHRPNREYDVYYCGCRGWN